MECLTPRSHIEATAGRISEASYKEKKTLTDEQIMDQFLDQINLFKKSIKTKVKEVEGFITSVEQLSWFDFHVLEEDSLQRINDVISASNDYLESLNRNYDRCLEVLKGRITIAELKDLKIAAEDLEEATHDLEKSVFFYSKDEDMKKVTDELSKL